MRARARAAVPRERWQPVLHRAAGAVEPSAPDPRAPGPEQLHEAVPRAVIAAIEEELIRSPIRLACCCRRLPSPAIRSNPSWSPRSPRRTRVAVLAALDELLGFDFIRPTDVAAAVSLSPPDRPPGRVRRHCRTAGGSERTPAHRRRWQPPTLPPAHARTTSRRSRPPAMNRRSRLLVQAGREAAPRAPETAGRWLLAATRLLPPDDDERSAPVAADRGGERADVRRRVRSRARGAGRGRARSVPDDRVARASRARYEDRVRPPDERSSARVPDSGRRDARGAPPDSPEALCLTLELALDHYWRGEFPQMYEVAQGVLTQARGRGEHLLSSWAAGAVQHRQHLSGPTGRRARRAPPGEGGAYDALTDDELAEYIDVAGYLAQAASAARADRRCARLCDPRAPAWRKMTGQGPYIPGQLVLQTNALFMKGRITEAMAVADTATDAAVLTGNDQFTVWALWADAMVCSCAGDTTRALASAREAVARSEHLTETFFSSLSRLHLAAALHAAGDAAGRPRRAGRVRGRARPAAARPPRWARLGASDPDPARARRARRCGPGRRRLAEAARSGDLATATDRDRAERQRGGAARPWGRCRLRSTLAQEVDPAGGAAGNPVLAARARA